jgi:hypothetical protein
MTPLWFALDWRLNKDEKKRRGITKGHTSWVDACHLHSVLFSMIPSLVSPVAQSFPRSSAIHSFILSWLSLISLSTAPIKLSQHGREFINHWTRGRKRKYVTDDGRAAAARRWQRSYQRRKDRGYQPATVKPSHRRPHLLTSF